MTIKTLKLIHSLLLTEHDRLSVEYEEAETKLKHTEKYYDVRYIFGRSETKYAADDRQEEWESGGKETHAKAVQARDAARDRMEEAASALHEFELHDFR